MHKDRDAVYAENYQSISLLATSGNIIQRIRCRRMTSILNKFYLPNEFCLRPNNWNTDALIGFWRSSDKTGNHDA